MNWEDLKYVLAVTEQGQLKDAAKVLGVDQATVGRRIRSFEHSLGVKLLNKRSNGYVLSAAGHSVLSEIKNMSEAADRIARTVSGRDEEVTGTLRVAMPGALANHWLMPHLNKFLSAHPRLSFEILAGPSLVNLSKGEADLAIRFVRPKQKDLHTAKLGTMALKLYGLDGTPVRKKQQLPMVALYPFARTASEDGMFEKLDGKVQPILWTAAWSSVYEGLIAGLGVGILPDIFEHKDPRLKAIDIVAPVKPDLWLVIHPDLKKSARVAAFTKFLKGLLL